MSKPTPASCLCITEHSDAPFVPQKGAITKTKIVCTIGPKSSDPSVLAKLFLAGMNVCRLNFSHGLQEEKVDLVRTIRQVAQEMGREVAILCDLQGPKIRCGVFADGHIDLIQNETVTLKCTQEPSRDAHIIPTGFAPLFSAAEIGDRILLDDGLLEIEVIGQETPDTLTCRVVVGGVLSNRKGMNLPRITLPTPALTEKDACDAEFICRNLDADYVALSFVRTAQDVQELRALLQREGKELPIIAKIEKPQAIDNLDAILEHADGIMIARGDLGVEVGNHRVPGLQKIIIKKCLARGLPVITATQMLDSMIRNPRPTRAEASDVANAIFDGTDAVMLSGETACGAYPVESVQTMQEIIAEAEQQPFLFAFDDWHIPDQTGALRIGMRFSKAAHVLAEETGATALACYSCSGKSAMRLAAQRPKVPIVMFSPSLRTVRRIALVRGCKAFLFAEPPSAENVFAAMESVLLQRGVMQTGDAVVFTAGLPTLGRNTTNTIQLRIAK